MSTPYLTGLARVLRSTGLPVVEVPGWQARNGHPGGFREVYGVVVHDTESKDATFDNAQGRTPAEPWLIAGEDAPTLPWVADMRGWRRGGAASYNVLIGRSGRVYVVAGGTAWQAGTGTWPRNGVAGSNPGVRDGEANQHTLGVSMDANRSRYPTTDAQRRALALVLKALNDEWGGDLAVMAHGEWAAERTKDKRTDPQLPWDDLRRAAKTGVWPGLPTIPTAEAQKPATIGPAPATVTVARGDTLAAIGRRYGLGIPAMRAMNPGIIPEQMRPGDTVNLRYTVARGDSLSRIGARAGVPWRTIATLNGLTAPYVIVPGQALRLA